MSKEAMKLALEALEGSTDKTLSIRAIKALRKALAEQPAQQEPYGYVSTHTNGLMNFNKTFHGVYRDTATEVVAVYTSSPAQRKPLTYCSECMRPNPVDGTTCAHGIKENT